MGGLFYWRNRMKKKFWNVLVEIYGDGTVKAAVLREPADLAG
jgi:hypothetical protein